MTTPNQEIFVFIVSGEEASKFRYTHECYKVFSGITNQAEIANALNNRQTIQENLIKDFLNNILARLKGSSYKRLHICAHFGGGGAENIINCQKQIHDLIQKNKALYPRVEFHILSRGNNIPDTDFWDNTGDYIHLPDDITELKKKLGIKTTEDESSSSNTKDSTNHFINEKQRRGVALIDSLILLSQALHLAPEEQKEEREAKRKISLPHVRDWWLCGEDITSLDGLCCNTTGDGALKTLYYHLHERCDYTTPKNTSTECSTQAPKPEFTFSEAAAILQSIRQKIINH